MFEVAEIKIQLDKHQYEKEVPEIRTQLLDVQQKLETAAFPVIIMIAGVDASGKGDVINILNEWLDPRFMLTHAFSRPSDEERERPHYWRYWMSLPSRGRIGIYALGWYGPPMADRIYERIGNGKFEAELRHINKLEKELVDDSALVIKFWLHLSKNQQIKRFEKFLKNPETRWRVTEIDRKHLKLYDRFIHIAERSLRQTSTADSPWFIMNGYDTYYRRVTVAKHIIERISTRLEVETVKEPKEHTLLNTGVSILSSLNLDQKIEKTEYQESLAFYQARISHWTRLAKQKKKSTILLFEGWDAAGKGGAIRRITQVMDARNYRVRPIAAPTDEEKSHHYLWRFWRHLPRDGRVTIYDRSWYGRVLVERVENYANKSQWTRAYSEINDFEEELSDHGIILVKFWMHIDKDEQLRRFKERENSDYKRYKITEEDYRNREKWDLYEDAVNDMVTHTSTNYAPWHLIEANDKHFGRIQVLKTIHEVYQKRFE